MGRASILALSLFALAACSDRATETMSRCYPEPGGCEPFMAKAGGAAEVDPALGRQIFLRKCATCHGRDGKGMGFPKRGNFTNPVWHQRFSDAALAGTVRGGRGTKMPGIQLEPIEMASLIAHLRSLRRGGPAGKKGY